MSHRSSAGIGRQIARRAALGLLTLGAALALGVEIARAAEVVPAIGWMRVADETRFDYDAGLPFADETREEFGVHLGGGLSVPVVPAVSVDLGGRYVMMRDQASPLIPRRFDPDFWVTQLGLAVRF